MSGPSLADLARYFLRLGALGFGGPLALAEHMRRDLVEARTWITGAEYETGLAVAAACPGPLAYQLAVYCGYVRRGVPGALAVAVAFALPPFLLVVAIAAAYRRFAGTAALRGLFYGIAPVVLALIARACWRLVRTTLARDRTAWACGLGACAVTIVVERELTILLLASGVLGIALFGRDGVTPAPKVRKAPSAVSALALALPLAPVSGTTASLFVFFFKTGCLVFGSGLVIVPLLKSEVVDQYGWLADHEFLDAIAIGMITPGPVVITATFVGYLVGGLSGALAATAGIFTPAILFTLLATPLLERHGGRPRLRGFVRGITVAVVGVLAGTTPLLARAAVIDGATLAIAAASLLALRLRRDLPEPLLVGSGGLIGLILHGSGATTSDYS